MGIGARTQQPCIAHDMEDGVGDLIGASGAVIDRLIQFMVYIDDVTQHREQMFADTLDHNPIHEGAIGGVFDLQLDTTVLLNDADIKISILFQ